MKEVAHIGSLEWAGALSLRSGELDRAALADAYNGEEGKRHREVLRIASPGILEQLATVVRERLAEIDQNGISSST